VKLWRHVHSKRMSMSHRETEEQLFIFYLPLISLSLTHTMIPLYLHRRNPVCYMNSRNTAIDCESQPNFSQFNCLLHVLAFEKANIRQLKMHEHSFNTTGCSVDGVGYN
jgi:hypothetical protein